MSELLTYRRAQSVATIVLDDGKVNVMSSRMLQALNEALDQAQWDQAVVVIAGRPGVFSAGFDLSVLRAGGDEANDMVRNGFRLAERLLSFPFPVVIACTGHALAMGAFLVLSGDHRIGADGPFKIGANEVAIGLTMPRFGIEICRQRLTPSHLQRAVINAEIFAPDAAVVAGFLDQVVPAQDVLSAAQLAAARLSSLNMQAHAATKQRFRESSLQAIRAAIEADASLVPSR
jgi:enoyl-CoA hydratase